MKAKLMSLELKKFLNMNEEQKYNTLKEWLSIFEEPPMTLINKNLLHYKSEWDKIYYQSLRAFTVVKWEDIEEHMEAVLDELDNIYNKHVK